jgi:hypothetical protein
MIVSSNTTRPLIDGIIFIDCWEPEVDQRKELMNEFYYQLFDNLNIYKFKCLVNSPSRLSLSNMLNDPSVVNTLQRYSWDLPFRSEYYNYIHNQLDSRIITSLISNSNGDMATSTFIKNRFLDNSRSICLFNTNDFAYHLENTSNNRCRNWLVVGQSWQLCTHDHGMGLNALEKLSAVTNMNFYATNWGFCKLNGNITAYEDFKTDSFDWSYIEGFGYRLVPRP